MLMFVGAGLFPSCQSAQRARVARRELERERERARIDAEKNDRMEEMLFFDALWQRQRASRRE